MLYVIRNNNIDYVFETLEGARAWGNHLVSIHTVTRIQFLYRAKPGCVLAGG